MLRNHVIIVKLIHYDLAEIYYHLAEIDSTECLLEAIKIKLECNNSIFNKKHYRQNRGTIAMGPNNACSYADLAMTTIDGRILDVNNRPDNVPFPPDWSRFRHDCFSIWFESVPSLLKFTDWLNSLSNSIKFTVKYSEVQLEVLTPFYLS